MKNTKTGKKMEYSWLVWYVGQLSLPSLRGVGKWVPASAGKAKAGIVHSVSGWTRGVQVKLWDPLRTCATPERLRGVFMIRRCTNPCLPIPMWSQPGVLTVHLLEPYYFCFVYDVSHVIEYDWCCYQRRMLLIERAVSRCDYTVFF